MPMTDNVSLIQNTVKIGKYELSEFIDHRGNKTIWISNRMDDGEGGAFDEDKIADVIDKFYKENF